MATTKRRATTFEVQLTPKKLRSDDAPSTESVVVLAPFQPHPKMTLDNIRVGSTGRLQLVLVNPNKKEMEIELVDVPSEEVGLKFSQTRIKIAGDSSTPLAIEWTPTSSRKPTRYVVGLRPVGRTRNISEIILTLATLQTQGVRSRVKQQDNLAKIERALKSRARPSTQNYKQESENEQDDRRATFTKVKTKIQWTADENLPLSHMLRQYPTPTERPQGRNSPLTTLNPPAEPSRPAPLNRTFNMSPNVSAGRRRSSDRFSTDSLESGTGQASIIPEISFIPHRRTSARSTERLNLDLVLPADFARNTEKIKGIGEDARTELVKIFSNVSSEQDSFTNEFRSPRRSLRSSNEDLNIDLFNLSPLVDSVRSTEPKVIKKQCTISSETVSIVTAKHSHDSRYENRSHCKRLSRSNGSLNLDSFSHGSPADLASSTQLNAIRTRCTKSVDRSDSVTDHDGINNEDRSRRRSLRSLNETLDIDLFKLDLPADLVRNKHPNTIQKIKSRSTESVSIVTAESRHTSLEDRSHCRSSTRSNDLQDLDAINFSPATFMRNTELNPIQEGSSRSSESIVTAEHGGLRNKHQSHRRSLRSSTETLEIDLFNLGLPADLVRNKDPSTMPKRSSSSGERVGIVTAEHSNDSRNKNRSYFRRLSRSNESLTLDIFNHDSLADLASNTQLNATRTRCTKSVDRTDAIISEHDGFKNDDISRRRSLRSLNDSLDIDLFKLDLPADLVRNKQPNTIQKMKSSSPERVSIVTAESRHRSMKYEDRSHCRSRTRSNDILDIEAFKKSNEMRKRSSKSADRVRINTAELSHDSSNEVGSHCRRRSQSNESLNRSSLADFASNKQPDAIQTRCTKSVNIDGAATSENDDLKNEDRSRRRSLRSSNESIDIDLFQLGLPADLVRFKQPHAMQGNKSKSSVTAEKFYESRNEDRLHCKRTSKSTVRGNINVAAEVISHSDVPLEGDCNDMLAPSPSKRPRPETVLDDSLEQKLSNQPLFNDAEFQSSETARNVDQVPKLLVTSEVDINDRSKTVTKTRRPEDSSAAPTVQPEGTSRSEGVSGAWMVSPPKRQKMKPPSDSPIVLPPPSRVTRISTLTHRLMNRPPSSATRSSTSRLDVRLGSASVGRKSQPPTSTQQALAKTKQQSGSVSRLVPRRLRLCSASSSRDSISSIGSASSMTSLASSSSSAFLCPPSATFLGHTIDLTKNPFHEHAIIYLENSWIDETEKELLKWVNKILLPPVEFQTTCLMPSKQEMQCVRPPVETAPYTETSVHRLFMVRRAATALLLSYKVAEVLHKVHTAIEKGCIQVRPDKDLHMDLGLQGIVVKLLMCYHPLWLRVALEAVYGRAILLRSNSDVVGLIAFIRRHLLTDAQLVSAHAHPTVPHRMRPPFQDKMKKFILEKFVMIVYFLDCAKTMKLIRHDPCLFCTDSPFKDSRAILLEFNKELIKGGDMTRYLSTMGLKLQYKQTYLEEFDYRVKDRSDMRDGVRLTKLVDTMLNVRLLNKLRVPAQSRTQKIHNVGVALKAYTENTGCELENGVTAQDVVNGHRERTLSLLWQLRDIRQQQAALVLGRFWRRIAPTIRQRMREFRQQRAAQSIQKWWRRRREESVSAGGNKGERQAFVRMRRAAIVIQRRWRATHAMRQQREKMLKLKKAARLVAERRLAILKMRADRANFLRLKSAAISIQRTWRRKHETEDKNLQEIANQQRSYYQKLKAVTIFVQRRWRTIRHQKQFLAKRQQQARIENAAVLVQRKWRAYVLMKRDQTVFQNFKRAVQVISNRRQALLSMQKQKAEYTKIKQSVIIIQRALKATLLMRVEQKKYRDLKRAAFVITERRLALLKMRKQKAEFTKLKMSVIILQRALKATLLMRVEQKRYRDLKRATFVITERRLALLKMRKQKAEFTKLKMSVIILQRALKATLQMRVEKKNYKDLKRAECVISERRLALLKMRKQKAEFTKLKMSVIIIQRALKATLLMRVEKKNYKDLKRAACVISERRLALLKMRKQKAEFTKLKRSVVILQRALKATLLMRVEQKNYKDLKRAAFVITERRLALLKMRKQKAEFTKLKMSVIILQRALKATLQMRVEKKNYKDLKRAACVISERRLALLKMRKQKAEFTKLKRSVIILQRALKATLLMREEKKRYTDLKRAVSIINERRLALVTMRKCRNEYLTQRSLIVKVQVRWKRIFAIKMAKKKSAEWLENAVKAVATISEQRIAMLKMRQERARYLKTRSSIVTIQRSWRKVLAGRQSANDENTRRLHRHACVIQVAMRNWISKKRERQQQEHLAALRIQRVWRGWTCRRRLREEGGRLSLLTMRAPTGGKTLRDKKRGILQTLCQSTSLHVLIRSLKELDVITTMSRDLAEELVHDGIIPALYNLLDKVLSRSESDTEAAYHIVIVLTNLYKHSSIASRVWAISLNCGLPAQIWNWAWKTCRNHTKFFCACITLLWLWAHQPQLCPKILAGSDYFMKRIGERMKEPQCARAARGNRQPLPSTTSDFGYTTRINHRPRSFQEPTHAWAQLKILLGPRQPQH